MLPELTVVIPVYNEEQTLEVLRDRLVGTLDELDLRWEILLVDDGSRDASWEIMQSLRQRDDRISLLRLSRNFGHQLAITAGMEVARGQAVVVMDADLQDPPEVVGQMVEKWREGYDVVYGVREKRLQETLFKRATAAIFYRFLDLLTPVKVPLDTGDFRLMSRRAVEAMGRMPERFRFVRGMVAWLGFRQTGVPFQRDPRASGTSKYPLRKMVGFAADGIISFSSLPLRLATSLGLVSVLGAAIYTGHAIWQKVVYGAAVPGWTSTISVVVFIGAAQLVCLGIIGEYVGRIYEEVKSRPLYLVDTLDQGPAVEAVGRRPRPTVVEDKLTADG